MDVNLLEGGIEALRKDDMTMLRLFKMLERLEHVHVGLMAVEATVKDGTLYKSLVKTCQDFGQLQFLLVELRDLGAQVEKTARRALEGSPDKAAADGHVQRFAERLRAEGLTGVKVEGCGSFSLSAKVQAFPPSKEKEPEAYSQFREWVKAEHPELMIESWSWQGLQTLCRGLFEQGTVPEFIKVNSGEEVKLRRLS